MDANTAAVDSTHLPEWVGSAYGVDTASAQPQRGGDCARTWDCGHLIIQHVRIQSRAHHEATTTLTKHLPEGSLPGLDAFLPSTLDDPEDGFWRAAHKIAGRVITESEGDDLGQTLFEAAAGVCAQLQALAKSPVQSLPTTWRQQNIGEAAINQLVEEFAPSQAHDLAATMRTFPTEPETALVLAHGDPVPKNTIMSATGPVLIDYELAQPLPAEYDIAHIAAHIAELLPAATALEITQHYLRERGLDHDRNAVAAACLWGRMRDRALWIREQPLRADDFDIIMALLAAA